MRKNNLTGIVFAALAVVAFVSRVDAYDWQAEQSRASGYVKADLDRFPLTFTDQARDAMNAKVQGAILNTWGEVTGIEDAQRLLAARIKNVLLRQPDSPKRAERLAANEALTELRLYFIYGHVLPDILNHIDDDLVQHGMASPFPVRPVLMDEARFKKESEDLVAKIGLSDADLNREDYRQHFTDHDQ